MEDPKPSPDLKSNPKTDLRLPEGDSPRPHRPRPTDPRTVTEHFAPLLEAIERPSAKQRLASKVDAPFQL